MVNSGVTKLGGRVEKEFYFQCSNFEVPIRHLSGGFYYMHPRSVIILLCLLNYTPSYLGTKESNHSSILSNHYPQA